jgi:hypothetical protein
MKCFLAGSLNDNGETTLVALAASGPFWDTFHLRWDTMLVATSPRVDFIHMPEIAETLLLDAVTLLDSLDKWTFRAFSCNVDLAAHARLLREGIELEDEATLCAEGSAGRAIQWYEDTHPVEPAQLFLDKETHLLDALRHSWVKHHKLRHGADQELFGGKVEEITSVELRAHPALQAAGMLAWGLAHPGSDVAELLIGDEQNPGAVALAPLHLGEAEMRAMLHRKKRHGA